VPSGGVFLTASSIELLGRITDMREPASHAAVESLTVAPVQVFAAAALRLTASEFKTMTWFARRLPSKTIAVKMGRECATVRKYTSQLLKHSQLRRRTEPIVMLADRCIRLGAPPLIILNRIGCRGAAPPRMAKDIPTHRVLDTFVADDLDLDPVSYRGW
jgi:hypothetical protein